MGKARRSPVPHWLRHRSLLMTEAVLVVGLLQGYGQNAVTAAHLPGSVKTLFVMAMTIGLLGFLVLAVQGVVGRVIGAAYDRIPAVPNTLLHLAAFAALFLLYARVNGFRLP